MLSLYDDAGSKEVMGDLDCLEKTLSTLLDDKLQGEVGMRVLLLLGEGATLALPVLGDALATMRRPHRL